MDINTSSFANLGTTQPVSVLYEIYAANNAPGAQGPQWPAVPKGPTGIQGPAGVTGATGPVDFIGSVDLAFSRDDIAGWTSVLPANTDDAIANAPLGFSVTIKGIAYTTVDLGSNGYIQFGNIGTVTFSNNALPSANFPNPTVCFYWHDMVTNGNGVRYITLGIAPNRVFYADYELRAFSGAPGETVIAQVQIHESSNLVNVRYYNTGPNLCGQSATIGIQGAGGASAQAFPVSYNAKIMDDNFNPQSVSFVMPK